MIKLLNRKPRNRRGRTATIIRNPHDDTQDLIMWTADAEALWNAGKLQKLLDLAGNAYGPPRSFRQMARNEWPPLHPDVFALCTKYYNATRKASA